MDNKHQKNTINTKVETITKSSCIKHIVLSGGGHVGFTQCAILKTLYEKEFYKFENIKTIYAASAGAILGVVLCLRHNFDDLIEYIVDRPWHESIELDISNFLNFYQDKGIFKDQIFTTMLKPLLCAKDLHINSTLRDLYNICKIELNIFSTKMEDFTPYRMNYKTHPSMTIIQAVHMSAAIPFIFQPVFYDNMCFMDGGIVNNYPLEICLNDQECSKFEVLAINNNIKNKQNDKIHKLLPKSNVIDICLLFFSHYNSLRSQIKKLTMQHNDFMKIPYEIQTFTNGINIDDLYQCVTNKEKRNLLLDEGNVAAQSFLKYLDNISNNVNTSNNVKNSK